MRRGLGIRGVESRYLEQDRGAAEWAPSVSLKMWCIAY